MRRKDNYKMGDEIITAGWKAEQIPNWGASSWFMDISRSGCFYKQPAKGKCIRLWQLFQSNQRNTHHLLNMIVAQAWWEVPLCNLHLKHFLRHRAQELQYLSAEEISSREDVGVQYLSNDSALGRDEKFLWNCVSANAKVIHTVRLNGWPGKG